MGPNLIYMLIRITYFTHVTMSLATFFRYFLPLSSPHLTTKLHILGAKDPYHSGLRTRQSMFDDACKALLLKLSDPVVRLEVRLCKDLSTFITGSRPIHDQNK